MFKKILSILILICFLCNCKNNELKQQLSPLDNMIGQVYYNCKITKIKKVENDTTLYCIYKGEELVIDIYSDLQTDEQIKDEFLDILESNEYDDYSVYY